MNFSYTYFSFFSVKIISKAKTRTIENARVSLVKKKARVFEAWRSQNENHRKRARFSR